MTEELPSIEALNAAAKEANFADWTTLDDDPRRSFALRCSAIAHARTLEQLWAADPSTKPVDEDLRIAREACAQVNEREGFITYPRGFRAGDHDADLEMQVAIRAVKLTREACNG